MLRVPGLTATYAEVNPGTPRVKAATHDTDSLVNLSIFLVTFVGPRISDPVRNFGFVQVAPALRTPPILTGAGPLLPHRYRHHRRRLKAKGIGRRVGERVRADEPARTRTPGGRRIARTVSELQKTDKLHLLVVMHCPGSQNRVA